MYAHGAEGNEDLEKALKWYRLSAEQGDSVAQYNLGVMYEDGAGVDKDPAEALKWYRLSAEAGRF